MTGIIREWVDYTKRKKLYAKRPTDPENSPEDPDQTIASRIPERSQKAFTLIDPSQQG
jgi:hypothetical protein